ncbi:hypothetical protein DYB32_000803 [Aphanomyces invadans]|uniref:Macro domain-containing protein n=1 Tax=Aphanomyces invadans TaxID=157072 RepID=A0A3R6ZAE2_9STRA|nr:hypothetical protein DYB32_000803 [Aphanomyces invadans]
MLPRSYRLSPTCTLVVSMGDITRWKGNAIVNAANEKMLGGSGVDGAIHRAAGPALRKACQQVAPVSGTSIRCPTGEARLTGGSRLPAEHVIHTVGPIYRSKSQSEPLLAASYDNSLALAAQHNFKSIAFPAISCGVFGYPLADAAIVAVSSCLRAASTDTSIEVIEFVLFSADVVHAWTAAIAKFHLEEVVECYRGDL